MSSDYTATFTAVANFGQLKREAKQAEADLKDLRKQQAELNAQSMASAPKINQFSEALAKAANVSKTHRDATRDLHKAQTDLASATMGAEAAFNAAKKAQADYSDAVRRTGANSQQAAAAHNVLRRALIEAESSSRRLERATRDLDTAHTKAASSVHIFHTAMEKIGNNQGALAHIVNLTTKLEMLGAKFLTIGSLISPAVAALSDFGGAAIALVGTLGPLTGSLAALPQLFSVIGQGAATSMLGFSGVMKAVGALNTAVVQAGTNTAQTAHQQQLAARAVADASRGIRDASENAARTARDTANQIQAANIQVRNSHEALQMAERGLIDTRREQTRALEDLETAVKREALAERSASLSVAEARANLQRAMLDPNATAFQKEEAQVQFEEATNRQQDVQTQGKRQRQDLSTEMKRGGVEGTNAVIEARRGLRDANESVTLSERELAKTIHDSSIANRNAREAEQRATLAYNDALYNQAHALDAVGTSAQNLKKIFADMSPAQIQMAKDIFALKGKLEALQDTASKGLLPGVEKGIKNLAPAFDVINTIVGKTASAFGDFIAKAAAHFTTPKWLDFFSQLGDSNIRILNSLSDAFLNIADAMADITKAAMPFVEWFAKGIDSLSGKAKEWTHGHGKELTDFFGPKGSLRQALHGWGDVLGNVGKILINTFKAAMPFGLELLHLLDKLTGRWAKAMAPPKKPQHNKALTGKPGHLDEMDFKDQQQEYSDSPFVKFQGFLEGSMPTLKAAGDVIGALVTAWVKLTTQGQKDSPKIFQAISDQLVPAITNLLLALGTNAPTIIHFFSQLAEALTKLLGAENGGTFKIALNILDTLASTLNTLLSVKGVGTLVKDLFLLAAALKAISLVSKITGIGGALGTAMSVPGRVRAGRAGYRAGKAGEPLDEDPLYSGMTERQQQTYRRSRNVGATRRLGSRLNARLGRTRLAGWMSRKTSEWDGAGFDENGYDEGLGYGGGGSGSGWGGGGGPSSPGGGGLLMSTSGAGEPRTRGRFRSRFRRPFGRGAMPNRWVNGRTGDLNLQEGTTSALARAGHGDEYDSLYASMMGGVGGPPSFGGGPDDEQTWAPSPGRRGVRTRIREHFARRSGTYKAIGKALPNLGIATISAATGAPVDLAAGTFEGTEELREQYRKNRGLGESGLPEGREPTRGQRFRARFARPGGTAAAIAGAVLVQHYGEGIAEKLSGDPHKVEKAQKEFDTSTEELNKAKEEAAQANLEHSRAVKAVIKAQKEAQKAQAEYEQHVMNGTENTKAGKAAAKKVETTQEALNKAMEEEATTADKAATASENVAVAQENQQAAGEELKEAKKEGNGLGLNKTGVALGEATFGLAAPQIAESLGGKVFGSIFGKREDEEGNVVRSRARGALSRIGGGLKRAAGGVGRRAGNLASRAKAAIQSRIAAGGGEGGFLNIGEIAGKTKDWVAGKAGDAQDWVQEKVTDKLQDKAGEVAGKAKDKLKDLGKKVGPAVKDVSKKVVDGGKEMAEKFAGHAGDMVSKVGGHMASMASKVGGAMSKIGSLMMANPWILLVAALVIVVVLVIKHWDRIKKVVETAIKWIWGFIKDHWPLILTILMGPLGFFISFLIKHWDAVKKLFTDGIAAVWKILKGSWALIKDLFMAPFRLIKDLMTGNFGDIKKMFQGLVDDLGGIWGGIKALFSAPVEFLVNTVLNDGIIKNVNKVLDKLPGGLHIPEIHFGGSSGGTAPALPKGQSAASIKRAQGGLIPGTGDSDSVDAMLTPGEFVIRKKAVKAIGLARLDAMNRFAGGGRVPHFDDGGFLGTGLGPSITGTVGGAWNGVKDATGAAWNGIKEVAGDLKDAGKWLAVKGIHKIRDGVDSMIDHIPGLFDILKRMAHGGNHAIFNGLETFIQGAQKKTGKAVGGQVATSGKAVANQIIGQQSATGYGWGSGADWDNLVALWSQESGWNELAGDPAHAYGIPQSLPGNKMASKGKDWLTNPATQIAWGLDYIKRQYGSPTKAWAHKAATDSNKGATGQYAQPGGWYAGGGLVRSKVTPGEYVMGTKAVQHYGLGTMNTLNHADRFFAGGGFVSRTPIFAGGGSVRPMSARSAATSGTGQAKVIHVESNNYWPEHVATDEATEQTMKKLAYLGVLGDD